MYIIGENIHIISEKVKEALKERNAAFFQELAIKQVEAGAQALDLNLGPRKKDGEEVFPWMVETRRSGGRCAAQLRQHQPAGDRSRVEENHQGAADHQLHLRRARTAGKDTPAGQEVQRPPGRINSWAFPASRSPPMSGSISP